MAKPDEYHCICGGESKDGGLEKGRPSRECMKCGKRWWFVACWASSRHLIDSRFAHKCGRCTYHHCPECGACNPRGAYECPCKGEALCA